MIAFLVTAALLAQAGPAPSVPNDDIVVTGERPRNFRIVTKRDRRAGVTGCTLKPPSGDPLFDTGICQAYIVCAPTARTAGEMEACMRPPLEREVKAWQDRRKAAIATRPPAG
ncbi:hypothetical protein [uncultured Sphingomonas sp.]|uniref:hypothetical protein n=1 Tax=uncultured Sphingomonas sp. TaxID=158754 RepID=UPI0025D25850|nr:hypothetical protein [uncultured Sphingomonas sp.]